MPRRDVKTHHSPVQTTPWTQDYRFNWSRVSLSSATALTTVLLNRRGSLVLDFIGSLPLFNRCLNLLTMLKQLAMEIMGLVCLPCSDVFLSAESLWQNWLEFANMFELPWNIIYGSTWYFPKYDDDDDKIMITAVIVQVTLPLFSYFFFYMTFLLLPISLPTCSILFYVYFPIYFASSFPLPYMMVPSWLLYISSGAQSHDFFLYCLGQILHSVTPVSLRCDANEIELHQHRVVQLCKNQSPYLFNTL